MSPKAPRIVPRSLITPADLEPFRAAVVQLPVDESPAAGRLPSFADVRRRLRRLGYAPDGAVRAADRS